VTDVTDSVTSHPLPDGRPAPTPDPNAAQRLVPVTTDHVLATPQGEVRYRATAGYLDLVQENIGGERAQEPNVKARVFLTTYVVPQDLSPGEPNPRPVIFIFNGGPGTSSIWLHLGLFGPRRVLALADDGTTPLPPPHQLVDNPESPLRYADLVLVDPVSTGYSRVVAGEEANQFHGVVADVESVSDVIRLWVTRHARWASPIFIAGESYGVLRSTKIADHIAHRYGLYPRGLILISSSLGGGGMQFGPGQFLSTHAFLPTYAAIAHYHGLHPGRTLREVVAEAEAYADGPLLSVLARGHRLAPAERAEAVATIARLTGLSPEFVDRVGLKIEKRRFDAELLRSRGLVTGEVDGRITGWNPDGALDRAIEDATMQVLFGAFAGAANHYFRDELGYVNDLDYEVWSKRVHPWKVPTERGAAGFDSIGALSSALRTNRHLLVQYHLGYYDACTPRWGAITDLAQLEIPPELRANIEVTHYESGHMIYIDEASRLQESADIERFVLAAINPS